VEGNGVTGTRIRRKGRGVPGGHKKTGPASSGEGEGLTKGNETRGGIGAVLETEEKGTTNDRKKTEIPTQRRRLIKKDRRQGKKVLHKKKKG